MKAIKYNLIDINVLLQDSNLRFNIYKSNESNTKMFLFKEKETLLTSRVKELISQSSKLYIVEDDLKSYQFILENYTNTHTPIKFEEKSEKIYSSAAKALDDLFSNPEALGNYEKSKEVVDNMVGTILDDNFTIKSLMKIANHDYYTQTHSINVTIYALSLGSFIGLEEEELSKLGESALLHDLGKSKIPSSIINKNGKLTEQEFTIMKKHPDLGFQLALKMGIKNKNILGGIRYHQEKMDGTGYPLGLKRDSIPKFARIIGLCDIFDALTTRRSYKEPMTTFDALKLIKSKMSHHVDLELLENIIHMFSERAAPAKP
ncbi:HD domain-containing protein [Sulfurimonas aquatica]|uniref:HD domain-containing protein n=1 Tax=Sulfurimonas aquatica TaxID=2672570 RepID=A0A975B219_9BACT|nr:HD-GYP domain-containing protein [Sulfurimonas aquatica]QSZ42703.1 HD domain-containing protein [Sulfurimonas aquatica]